MAGAGLLAVALPGTPLFAEARMVRIAIDPTVDVNSSEAVIGTPRLGASPTPADLLEQATPQIDSAAGEGSSLGMGMASYYGRELAGRRTASGERFNPAGLTAAHRTLPLGSRVRVTNPANGDSVVVRINDRGPFHGNRVIDLSEAAAREIGIAARGSGRVQLALLDR